MADIELVIKIPEEVYNDIKEGYYDKNLRKMAIAIGNGTLLPKGHEKIIDTDSIPSYRIRGITEYCRGYNDRTTEVENAIINAPTIIEANY